MRVMKGKKREEGLNCNNERGGGATLPLVFSRVKEKHFWKVMLH